MIKHSTTKKIRKKWERGVLKTVVFLLLLIIIILLSVFITPLIAPDYEYQSLNINDRFIKLLTSQSFVATLLTALMSATLLFFADMLRNRSEEYTKLNDDKRAIIHKYSYHSTVPSISDQPYQEYGHTLGISFHVRKKRNANGTYDTYRPRTYIYPYLFDKFSSMRTNYYNDYNDYVGKPIKPKRQNNDEIEDKKDKLALPNVNVYANLKGTTKVVINDSNNHYNLPDFLINCAANLITAHKHSKVENATTIRLADIQYDKQNDCLTLSTERADYYQMLITNRCMDYRIEHGVTVRELYEHEDKISKLSESEMCNQIGINGVVITKDNYLLIEKRSHKKTTWKNKFAQPISLALKLKNIEQKFLNDDKTIITDEPGDLFGKIVTKTLKDNFGLRENDFRFDFSENFLGLARDLIEGGKPNLYFFVVVNKTAKELKESIKEFNKTIPEKDGEYHAPLSRDKLQSEYYLMKYNSIELDFKYGFTLNSKTAMRIQRKLHPRVKHITELVARLNHFYWGIRYHRECGDALLACIAYLELEQNRIDDLIKKMNEATK